MMNTFISKFAIIPPNKQVVTKERLRLTLTVMVMKTTFAQDCKKFNSTCWLQVNHSQLLKQNIYFVFIFWSLEVEYLRKCNIYNTEKTCRFSPVAVRLISHRLAPGRASADLIRDF